MSQTETEKTTENILSTDPDKLDSSFFDPPPVQHVMTGDYGDEIVMNLFPSAETNVSTSKSSEIINNNRSVFTKLREDSDNEIFLSQTYNTAVGATSQLKHVINPPNGGPGVMYAAINIEDDEPSAADRVSVIEIEKEDVRTKQAKKTMRSEKRTPLPASVEHMDDPVRNLWVTSKEHKEQLKENGLTWETGMWSKTEVEILKQNIDKYCLERGIDDPGRIIFHTPKEERKDFYPTIALGLNRPVFAVYRRVKRMYNEQNYKGKYSREEVDKLKDLRKVHGRNWKTIAEEMGRSSDSVKDRFRLLKDKKRYGKWSADEEEMLANAVYTVTRSEYGESITEGIPWPVVADKVKTRTAKQCRTKWLHYLNWKLMRGKDWTKEDDKLLVQKIARLSPQTENEINWTQLTAGWESARSPSWLRQKWSELKKMLYECDLDFPDTVKLLDKLYMEDIFKIWDRPKQMVKFLIGEQKEKNKGGAAVRKIAPASKKARQDPPNGPDAITTSIVSQSDETETAPLYIQTTDSDHLVSSDIISLSETTRSKEDFDLSTTSDEYVCEESNATLGLPQGTYHLTPTSSDGLFLIYSADNHSGEEVSLADDDSRIVNITLAPEVLSSMLKLDGGSQPDDVTIDGGDSVYLSQTSSDNPILSSVARDVTVGSHDNEDDDCLFVT